MSDAPIQPNLPPPRVLWGRVATAVVVVLVAFGLGRCTAEGIPQDEVTQLETEVSDLQSANDRLQDQVDRLGEEPTEADETATTPASPAPSETTTPVAGEGDPGGTWTVAPGDTLHAIAIEVYDDRAKAALIAAANGIDTSDPLQVGQELQLPSED